MSSSSNDKSAPKATATPPAPSTSTSMQTTPSSSSSTFGANFVPVAEHNNISSSAAASLKRKRGSSPADGEVQKVTTGVKRINLGEKAEELRLWDELKGLSWKGEGWKTIKGLEHF